MIKLIFVVKKKNNRISKSPTRKNNEKLFKTKISLTKLKLKIEFKLNLVCKKHTDRAEPHRHTRLFAFIIVIICLTLNNNYFSRNNI